MLCSEIGAEAEIGGPHPDGLYYTGVFLELSSPTEKEKGFA